MTNPYQSPAFDPQQFQDASQPPMVSASDYGWLNQVRIFAVLNAVQGAMEFALGGCLVGMACYLPIFMKEVNARAEHQPGGAPPEEFLWYMVAGYAGVGTFLALLGVVRIWAAIQNFRFRGQTLGIVSISLGMLSVFVCYCAPTAIGLLVYGLIVLLRQPVRAAFAMGKQGMPAAQILAAFIPYRPDPYAQPPQ